MSKQPNIIYYEDELHDEFATDHIEARKIDGSYRYLRDDAVGRIFHIFWYFTNRNIIAFIIIINIRFHLKQIDDTFEVFFFSNWKL